MDIRVLGVSASPRKGNSLFLLKEAMARAGDFPWDVRYTEYDLAGKRLLPCTSCHHCRNHHGDCGIDDDFASLRQAWVENDVIIYSIPVYHVGIPAQLKAFLDRLGNSLSGYYGVSSARPLKVIGALVQGCHLFGGQELAASMIVHHAVLMGSIPVAGDRPESYIAGLAWTGGDLGRDSLEGLCGHRDRDAEISLRGAASVVRRAVEMAALIKSGASACAEYLRNDPRLSPILRQVLPQGREESSHA